VVKAFQTGLYKLKTKFADQICQNPGDYFTDNAVAQCKKELRNDRSRNLIEGDDNSDLFDGVYPLPRKHSAATMLLPVHHFLDAAQ
jgi:hypothetical protein